MSFSYNCTKITFIVNRSFDEKKMNKKYSGLATFRQKFHRPDFNRSIPSLEIREIKTDFSPLNNLAMRFFFTS